MLWIASMMGPQKLISTASWSSTRLPKLSLGAISPPPALATLSPLRSGWSSCQEGTFPSRWAPTSSRRPSQIWGSPSIRLPALASLLWEQGPCTPGSLNFWELQGWRGHRLCE